MIQTRFAPTALAMKAKRIRLKTANANRAYGRKHRRIMNSVLRARYINGLLFCRSAFRCQTFKNCSG